MAFDEIISWCYRRFETYDCCCRPTTKPSIEGFCDGILVCALVHTFLPRCIDPRFLSPLNSAWNLTLAFYVAEKGLGIPRPSLSLSALVDKDAAALQQLAEYLKQFKERELEIRLAESNNRRNCNAMGGNTEEIDNISCPNISVTQAISYMASTQPDHPAFYTRTETGGTWQLTSWRQYCNTVCQVAGSFQMRRFARGFTVCTLTAPRPESVVFCVSSWLCGGVCSFLPFDMPIGDIVEAIKPVVLLVETKHALASLVRKCKNSLSGIRIVVVLDAQGPDLTDVPFEVMPWVHFLKTGPVYEDKSRIISSLVNVDGTSPATIVCERDTRANPSGVHTVTLSHNQVLTSARFVADRLGILRADTCLIMMPLARVSSQLFGIYIPALLGHSVYFDLSDMTATSSLRELQPTVVHACMCYWEGVHATLDSAVRKSGGGTLSHTTDYPEMVKANARHALGLSNLRVGLISSTSQITQRTMKELVNTLEVPLYSLYGYPETSGAAVLTCWSASGLFQEQPQVCCLGDVSLGADSEVLLKSPFLPSSVIQSDGFFHTGDVGEKAGEAVVVAGRLDSTFKLAGGEEVRADVVDVLLRSHPLVSAAAAGRPGAPYLAAVLLPNTAFIAESGMKTGHADDLRVLDGLVAPHLAWVNRELAAAGMPPVGGYVWADPNLHDEDSDDFVPRAIRRSDSHAADAVKACNVRVSVNSSMFSSAGADAAPPLATCGLVLNADRKRPKDYTHTCNLSRTALVEHGGTRLDELFKAHPTPRSFDAVTSSGEGDGAGSGEEEEVGAKGHTKERQGRERGSKHRGKEVDKRRAKSKDARAGDKAKGKERDGKSKGRNGKSKGRDDTSKARRKERA